jgi:hypothetical protein
MRHNKFEYEKAIQQRTAQGWEDVSTYECNSMGKMRADDRAVMRADAREYQASKTGPVRIVGPRRIKMEVAR